MNYPVLTTKADSSFQTAVSLFWRSVDSLLPPKLSLNPTPVNVTSAVDKVAVRQDFWFFSEYFSFLISSQYYMCHKDKQAKSGNIQTKAYTSVLWTTFDRKIFSHCLFFKEGHNSASTANTQISCHPLNFLLHFYAKFHCNINPYPTAFPYGNGMVLHFYQQQESSTTKTVHKVINKGLKTYV